MIHVDDEGGAVLVWVGLMIGVLLGIGALVVDAGALYAERRQLQNGADAAALAVAADCALGDCRDEAATAARFADANANDGAAGVDAVCGVGPGLPACATPPAGVAGASGWVQVHTSTDNPAGRNADEVDLLFAPLLDAADVGRAVHASAVAVWGSVAATKTASPFTFSLCEYQALGGSLDGGVFPTSPGYVYLHGEGPDHSCAGNPSGQNLPGGFGWLATGDCAAAIAAAGAWVLSETGSDLPCDPAPWRNQVVLLPLYDDARASGTNGEYHIAGFVGFRVLGYFLGNQHAWNLSNCPGTTGSSGRCLYGEFTRITTADGTIGSGRDYGARVIAMAG